MAPTSAKQSFPTENGDNNTATTCNRAGTSTCEGNQELDCTPLSLSDAESVPDNLDFAGLESVIKGDWDEQQEQKQKQEGVSSPANSATTSLGNNSSPPELAPNSPESSRSSDVPSEDETNTRGPPWNNTAQTADFPINGEPTATATNKVAATASTFEANQGGKHTAHAHRGAGTAITAPVQQQTIGTPKNSVPQSEVEETILLHEEDILSDEDEKREGDANLNYDDEITTNIFEERERTHTDVPSGAPFQLPIGQNESNNVCPTANNGENTHTGADTGTLQNIPQNVSAAPVQPNTINPSGGTESPQHPHTAVSAAPDNSTTTNRSGGTESFNDTTHDVLLDKIRLKQSYPNMIASRNAFNDAKAALNKEAKRLKRSCGISDDDLRKKQYTDLPDDLKTLHDNLKNTHRAKINAVMGLSLDAGTPVRYWEKMDIVQKHRQLNDACEKRVIGTSTTVFVEAVAGDIIVRAMNYQNRPGSRGNGSNGGGGGGGGNGGNDGNSDPKGDDSERRGEGEGDGSANSGKRKSSQQDDSSFPTSNTKYQRKRPESLPSGISAPEEQETLVGSLASLSISKPNASTTDGHGAGMSSEDKKKMDDNKSVSTAAGIAAPQEQEILVDKLASLSISRHVAPTVDDPLRKPSEDKKKVGASKNTTEGVARKELVAPPLAPEEDTTGNFMWQMLPHGCIDSEMHQLELEQKGYVYTKTFHFAPHITQHYYRKASSVLLDGSKVDQLDRLPLTPEEDTKGLFTWQMVPRNATDFPKKQERLEQAGYSYTKTFEFAPHIIQLYYRKASSVLLDGREVDQHDRLPLTPEEDTKGLFTWQMLPQNCYGEELDRMQKAGYSYTKTFKFAPHIIQLYYRKASSVLLDGREVDQLDRLPLTPEEDTKGLFTWQMVPQNATDFPKKQERLEQAGYSYTKTFEFAPHITQLYYRKTSSVLVDRREIDQLDCLPLTPDEDTKGLFTWQMLPQNCYGEELDRMQKAGYSYTKTFVSGSGRPQLYYRKASSVLLDGREVDQHDHLPLTPEEDTYCVIS